MAHLQLSEGSIPPSPASGKRIIFASSDGIYGLDSAGGTTIFGAAGAGGGIAAAAGTQTAASGTIVFSNSNNFTFGMSGSTRITASFSESTHSHATAAYSGSNGSFTANTLSFGNLNGVSFYTSNGSIVASYTDGGGGGGGIAAAAGTQTGTSGTIVFANSNNMTFGMSGSSQITGSFSQSVQTQASGAIAGSGFTSTTTAGTAVVGTHNSAGLSMAFPVALTTARASTDAIGLATAQSNVTWTVNSAGLSFDARGYAGTASSFGGTNISGSMTHNSGGLTLSMSVAAPSGGGGIAAAAGTQTATSGTVVFANSNNFTFGMSGSSQVTASFSESTHSHATPAFSGSNGSFTAATLTFGSSNSMHFYTTNGSIVGSFSQSTHSHATPAFSGSNGSFTANTVTFGALNGLTFYTSNGSMVGSHNALTSQSNQAFSAAGGSSAFQTLGFSDTNGVSFSNSNGSVVATVRTNYASSVHDHNATLYATSNTTQSSSGTVNISSIVFAGAGIASVGVTNGSVVISVPSGGGAGDGGNILAAGTRTAGSNSTVLFSNANGVTFGLDAVNGSVMTASVAAGGADVAHSFWPFIPLPLGSSSLNSGTTGGTGGSFQTTAHLYISPLVVDHPLTFGEVEIAVSHGGLSAGTGSVTFGHMLGVYSLNGGTALSLVSSFEFNARYSQNSATAVSAYFYWGTNSTSNSTSTGGNVSASFTGPRQIKLYDSTGSFSDGDYWVAHAFTARSSSVHVLTSFATGFYLSQSQTALPIAYFGNNTTAPTMRFIGSASTTQNNAASLAFAMPASIHTSAITNTGGSSQHRFNVPRFYV